MSDYKTNYVDAKDAECFGGQKVRVTGYKFEVILTPKDVEVLSQMAEREGDTLEEFVQQAVKRAAKSALYELREEKRFVEARKEEHAISGLYGRLADVLEKIEKKLG